LDTFWDLWRNVRSVVRLGSVGEAGRGEEGLKACVRRGGRENREGGGRGGRTEEDLYYSR
jgi:hypothetical protein